MKDELERLKKKIAELTPGTEEYERTLSEIERVTKLVRQEDLDTDKRIREQKQLELDEKRFQHEQMKFEQQLEDNGKKEAFEQQKFEFEQKKFEFEQQKFNHQSEVDEKKLKLEEEKIEYDEAEREYEHGVRYTGRQIVKRVIELTAETACTAVLIGLIGNLEQTTILSKTAMAFVKKKF